MKPILVAAALVAAVSFAHEAYAASHQDPAPAAAAAADFAEGEVTKVDKEAGKVTLKHGPIPSLDMPPMRMVFRVKEPAMLDAVKVGDRIRFKAEKIGGAYTVTELAAPK